MWPCFLNAILKLFRTEKHLGLHIFVLLLPVLGIQSRNYSKGGKGIFGQIREERMCI